MENRKHELTKCSICENEIEKNPRYEKEVCKDCQNKATDINGRKLIFYEDDTIYEDNNTLYESNLCYINNIECFYYARYFGGTVIEMRAGQKMDLRKNG